MLRMDTCSLLAIGHQHIWTFAAMRTQCAILTHDRGKLPHYRHSKKSMTQTQLVGSVQEIDGWFTRQKVCISISSEDDLIKTSISLRAFWSLCSAKRRPRAAPLVLLRHPLLIFSFAFLPFIPFIFFVSLFWFVSLQLVASFYSGRDIFLKDRFWVVFPL